MYTGSYLTNVGTGRHRELNAVDGEDNVRQAVHGVAVDQVLRVDGKSRLVMESTCLPV